MAEDVTNNAEEIAVVVQSQPDAESVAEEDADAEYGENIPETQPEGEIESIVPPVEELEPSFWTGMFTPRTPYSPGPPQV